MPRSINDHIGKRLRQRRTTLGLSQSELAQTVGVAAQQVQKYETGANIINVERLQQFAGALQVPIGWFFEAAGGAALNKRPSRLLASDREALEIIKSFKAIKDRALRKRLADLLRLIAVRSGTL